MDRAAKFLYRVKGLIFRILVIYLNVVTQIVYIWTVTNREDDLYVPQNEAEAHLVGEVPFPAWYPFDYKSSNGLYFLAVAYQLVSLTCSALFNVSCDSLFALLLGTLSDILNLFGTPVLLQLFCSVFILCITGLHLVADEHTVEEFIFVLLYLLCLITQVFTHCHFGNETTYTSKRVHQATSFVNYPDMDIRTRKLLIMFQHRTVTELKCFAKAVLHIELSMATFVTIIKSSYSFLTVLRSMTE
ncbi:odorant receptor Or1-like [Anopheles cruzii]|uniref:odorant receptor Or1-like n=1 Tax=Anopheles cruzii TaxID=68878 RepID=UPI0022EC4F46|nr:odorant receptor Or1-like [Anopheles cruzii]